MSVSSRVVAEGGVDCVGGVGRGADDGKIRRARAVRNIFVRILVSPVRVSVGRE
jgi:hypothetical protein